MRLVAGNAALRPWIATVGLACVPLLVAAVSCAATESITCRSGQDYVATEPVIEMDQTACGKVRENAVATFCFGRSNNVSKDYEKLYEGDFILCRGEVAELVPILCRKTVENSSLSGFVCVRIPKSAKHPVADDEAKQKPDQRTKSTDDDVSKPRSKGSDYQPIPGACRITGTC